MTEEEDVRSALLLAVQKWGWHAGKIDANSYEDGHILRLVTDHLDQMRITFAHDFDHLPNSLRHRLLTLYTNAYVDGRASGTMGHVALQAAASRK